MENIKKEQLQDWLTDNLIKAIHSFEAEDFPEFDEWTKSYPDKAAKLIVNAEFGVDWMDDEREEIPVQEAKDYVKYLLQRIVSSWGA